jgi:hypothetical protein
MGVASIVEIPCSFVQPSRVRVPTSCVFRGSPLMTLLGYAE